MTDLIHEMSTEDWHTAIEKSKQRNIDFPMYERRTSKLYSMISEEEENDVMEYITPLINNQLEKNIGNTTNFQKMRIMTYVVSRTGNKSGVLSAMRLI